MFLKFTIAIFSWLLISLNAVAFDPIKENINVIIPFPPGGGADLTFKVMQNYAAEKGIKMIPIYKPGAEGIIGMREISQSPNNGYYISITTIGVVAIQKIKEPNYANDVITGLNSSTMVFITSVDSKFNDLNDVENSIKNKNSIVFAEGSPTQKLSIKKFIEDIDKDNKTVLVSYNGTNAIIKDIVGNHVDIAFVPLSTVQGLVKAEKIKIIGITGEKFSSNFSRATSISKEYQSFQNFAGFLIVVPKNLNKESKIFWEEFFQEYLNNSRIKEETIKSFSESYEFGRIQIESLIDSMVQKLR